MQCLKIPASRNGVCCSRVVREVVPRGCSCTPCPVTVGAAPRQTHQQGACSCSVQDTTTCMSGFEALSRMALRSSGCYATGGHATGGQAGPCTGRVTRRAGDCVPAAAWNPLAYIAAYV